jgi:hypothetical protein
LIRRLTLVQGAIDEEIERRSERSRAKSPVSASDAPAAASRKTKAQAAGKSKRTPGARATTRPAPAS